MNSVFRALVPALQVYPRHWWDSESGQSWSGYDHGSHGSWGGSWT